MKLELVNSEGLELVIMELDSILFINEIKCRLLSLLTTA